MKYLYNDPASLELRRRLRSEMTDAERLLWRALRNKQLVNHRFLRQFSVGKYILDFYCPELRIGIEVDGGQHNDPVVQSCDQERTAFLGLQNITVLRFWNNDVMKNLDGVVEEILKRVTPPNLPLS